MKVLELFGGIGACSKALERLGIDYEIADYVEIDKYAVKSFNAIHNTNFEPQDIMTWNKDIDVDLIMHGSPCQDFSLAGLQAGGDEGSGTRSSLMYETIRIVKKLKPKYVVWENVKNLLSKKHRHNFDAYLERMESLGYQNYYQVLNAKDYGIPQNRERVFTVSILKDVFVYDLPDNYKFEFPPKQELKLKLKDLLEEEVDEKFYLSQKMIDCFMSDGTGKYPRRERFLKNIGRENIEVGNSVTTLAGSRPTDNFVIEDMPNQRLRETLNENDVEDGDFIDTYNRSVQKGKAGTITTKVSSSNNMFVAVQNEKEKLCDELIEDEKIKEGEMINHSRDGHIVSDDGITPTITTRPDELGVAVVDLKRGYPCTVKEEQESTDKVDVIGNYSKSGFNQTSIVGKNGIAPTVTENHGQVTAIAIKNNTKKGYLLAEEGDAVDISGRMQYHRGTVQKGITQTITTAGGDNVGVVVKESVYTDLEKKLFTEDGNIKRYIDSDIVDEFKDGQMATTSYPNGYGHGTRVHNESVSLTVHERPSVKYNLRIRKLTPKECWRLMGFDDEDFEKAKDVPTSNNQLYKQAGNSIVVNVLEKIFKNLFKEE